MSDFVTDILAGDNEESQALLRQLGLVEYAEVCEHDWHRTGTVNGRTVSSCQKCGVSRERYHAKND